MLALSAGAVETARPTKEAEAALKKIAPFMKVESYFAGPGNLIGVAARYNGQPLVFFTDPKGQYMVTGAAIDMATGKNLIAEASSQYFTPDAQSSFRVQALPTPKKSSVDSKSLEALAGISQGERTSGKKAYVVFDFGCGHCMRLYDALAKEKLSGELIWVPVTFSGEVATTKSALAVGTGRIGAVKNLTGRALTDAVVLNRESFGRRALAVEANTTFARERDINATPYFYFYQNGVLMEHDGYADVVGIARALGVQ